MTFMTKNRSSQLIRKPARARRKESRHDTATPSKMKNSTPTFKASNTSHSLTRRSQARVQYGTQNPMDTKPATHKDHNNIKPIWQTIVL
jgi:hypothetical protein